ncbi:MAG: ATP-binding protein [Prevotellaceae bacterium]|nr:ATP-binding protein [Prevotellaceae bacterium]
MENLDKLVTELCKLPRETEWVEFKHNNCDPQMIARDISALANSAVVVDREHSYMLWGVDDKTHELIDTNVRLRQEKKGNQELENWLRGLLSKNADFEMSSVEIGGKHVELLIISKAVGIPVAFEKVEYIRVGSYTKRIIECPALQAQLWDKLRNAQFEETYAKTELSLNDVVALLKCDIYFENLNLPLPTSVDSYKHYLLEEGIVEQQDNGLFAITNLGAILFAKKLSDFPRLGRKAIRIVQYEGKTD